MAQHGLAGRVAIVTGASDGLGKEFAHGLAEAGARIVVAARRTELLEQFAEELRREHAVEALAVPTDVSDEDSVTRLIDGNRRRIRDGRRAGEQRRHDIDAAAARAHARPTGRG